jgi:hypothetical protein
MPESLHVGVTSQRVGINIHCADGFLVVGNRRYDGHHDAASNVDTMHLLLSYRGQEGERTLLTTVVGLSVRRWL